jgi:phosphopantetheine adenylyltransferase
VERKAQSINDIIRNKTKEEDFDREIFNSENIEWAMMILETRATQIGFELLLVPMLDMVNIKESAKNPSRTMKLRFEENKISIRCC